MEDKIAREQLQQYVELMDQYHCLHRKLRAAVSEHGLVPQHLALLHVLHAPRTMGELAKELGLTMPSITGLYRPLEDHGLIKTINGTKDRRTRIVSLTAKGFALLDEVTA